MPCVPYGGVTKKIVTKGPAAEVECKEHVCVDSCIEHVNVCICADPAGKDPSTGDFNTDGTSGGFFSNNQNKKH